MNERNSDYLKERMFFLGFGDKLNADLDKNISAKSEHFQLQTQGEFTKGDKKQIVDYALDFTKSKQTDAYYFNNYKATLKGDNSDTERSQTFYINKGNGITAKEAFNLLDGRAVYKKLTNKKGEPYEAWLQLHAAKEENGNHKLHQYHAAWGFDLKKTLEKHPIKELTDSVDVDQLMKSLQKGNLALVHYNRGNKDEKMFIAANPKDRSIDIYDMAMRNQFQGIRVHKQEQAETRQEPSESKSQKEKSQKKTDESEPAERKSKSRRIST